MIPIDYIIDVLLFLVPLLYLFIFKRHSFTKKKIISSFGLKRINLKYLLKESIKLFFIIFLISSFLGLLAYVFGFSDLHLVQEKITNLPIYYVIYLFVIRVFLEEWFFRAFLTRKLGVILSSVFFSAGHFAYGSIIEVLGAFVLGVVLARYFLKTNSLYINYAAHLLYNLLAYASMMLA